ncbi:hypothetical protein [Oenococcus oeni]|uniref:Uncharacterized protein n=1 Tax=Oenococcus oeni TaxID=1247 RepID=A0AAJ2UBN1_OENOE|nr:hypothetical protein [Oenococcus oeni]MDV7715266.1 hypothetical protein [Oenococcus oeni]
MFEGKKGLSKIRTKEDVNKTLSWFAEQADKLNNLITNQEYHEAIIQCRELRNIMKEDEHELGLSRNELLKEEYPVLIGYHNYLRDALYHETGAITKNNLHSFVFDIKNYVIFYKIQ